MMHDVNNNTRNEDGESAIDTATASASASISLEKHAQISAEIAEGVAREADVLKSYGITTEEWTEATRYHMTAIAEDAQRHGIDAQLAVKYSDSFSEHQQGLKPALNMTPEQWSELQFDIDRESSTEIPLASRQMSLADYMRLVRIYAKRIAEEPDVALRVERRRAELEG